MKLILAFFVIYMFFLIPSCIGMGLIFKKLGKDFKIGLIPIYNKILLIQDFKLDKKLITLSFIPIVNIYVRYILANRLAKIYNKDVTYILELTLIPYVFNILLGQEKIEKETIGNYFEDQEALRERITEETEKINEEDYVWHPVKDEENVSTYKASKNNIKIEPKIRKKDNEILEVCPKCGTSIDENAEVCFLCGTKIK